MSGIAGIIRFDGAPVEPGLIQQMTAGMSHRGPDGIKHWTKGSVALGHCMLRTTPESLEENQPLANEDESLVLVMDGRVDNWEELRKELLGRGVVLRTRADTELVLRSYELWGENCLEHIDGECSLVIWDARNQAAFCARDRVGNKSFSYYWDGKTLIFASELHTILALPGVKQEFNEGLLAEYLANEWYSRDETFWKGVSRLVGGHRMKVDRGGTRITRYWQPDLWATLPYKRDEEFVEHYRALLADVVRRMSRSHLPVAFEVSGGLDSSALFAMAEHLRRQQQLPAPEIRAYAMDYHDDVNANELEYGRAVGQFLGISVKEILPTQMPVSWYRNWAKRYREMPSSPNAVQTMGLRETARQEGARVIVAGVGGDEWVGMPWTGAYYSEELALHQWRNVMTCFKNDIEVLGISQASWWLFRYGAVPVLPEQIKYVLRKFRRVKKRESWLSPHLQRVLDERRDRLKIVVPQPLARRGQHIQTLILEDAYEAAGREFEDRLNSSLQLELRRPFFNHAIIQFSFSTPERLRSRGRLTKWLHRQAMRGLLPDKVLDRTTKADFMVAFHRYLENLGHELAVEVVPRRAAWLKTGRAMEIVEHYHDVNYTGWAEWWLWSLIGCDALSTGN